MASVDSVPAFLLAGVPVMQPPHLEGDPSLATEILPGPPSLLSIQQSGLPRKENKKSATSYSYLPVSDPGTTYGGHMVNPMATSSTSEVDGPRRKRARLDKSASSSRAQRASARQLAAPSVPLAQEAIASTSLIPDSDPIAIPMDDDDVMMISRSNSVPNGDTPLDTDLIPNGDEDSSASTAKRSRRDKGKGKEKDAGVRVKEEPGPISLNLHDSAPALSNEDHCSSCRSFGSLVYCDSCPRAFHLLCLNPPMESNELQGDSNWYCPACTGRKQKAPPKQPASLKFMAPLFDHLQTSLPHEFQLPLEMRTYFKDVATSNRGTYVDSSELKPARVNRLGLVEDRDPYRLKDRFGEPVLCFKCGTSALPPGVSASAPSMKRPRRASSRLSSTLHDTGKSIISCDYCHLHWHLDCVDPPLAMMPPWGKRWMCPNHADQILKPKKRVPRAAAPVEVTKTGEVNNGNIEIKASEEEASAAAPVPAKMAVEEVLINGRRYRVPERIITLDFWNKTRRREYIPDDHSSAMSSPLTSLSSLEDVDDTVPPSSQLGLFNVDELRAALHLVNLHTKPSTTQLPNGFIPTAGPSTFKTSVPTTHTSAPPVRIKEEPDLHVNGLLSMPPTTTKRVGRPRGRAERPAAARLPVNKALRSSARVQAAAKKNADAEAERSSLAMPPPPQPRTGQKSLSHVLQANGITAESSGSSLQSMDLGGDSVSAPVGRIKRTRQPRRKQSPAPTANSASYGGSGVGPSSSLSTLESSSHDEAAGSMNSVDGQKHASSSRGRHPKPITPNPSLGKPSAAAPATPINTTSLSKPPGAPTTPSLKIRLPRLSSISSPIFASSSNTSATDRDRDDGKASSSRSRPVRSRRLFDKQSSTSTSNDGPNTESSDSAIPPPA